MDKTAIKNFAIESRKKLMDDVKYRMNLLGIFSDEKILDSISDIEGVEAFNYGAGSPYQIFDEDIDRRNSLVREVRKKGFDNVVEEVAYTWFNRIIAIRFMEVNNYLPTKTRVLSSETMGKNEPDIVTYVDDIDLNFSKEDKELIFKLQDEHKSDELFRFLFIKQCNELNSILPGLFEKTEDYMELLLNISYINDEGVVRQLVDTISEEDFTNQVEIIGWLYQYYNTELKDDTFAKLKKRVKISKERIPSVTQLFTPDWIVKYMVENSLGRLWLDIHPDSRVKDDWVYYRDEKEQIPVVESELNKIKEIAKDIKIENIKIIDPSMGSGHVLVYAFDVLMQIYISQGYSQKDAAESILQNNIYGLDIDDRAYQLSYFALMMKARNFNRKIFDKSINPLICSIKESNSISKSFIKALTKQNPKIKGDLCYLIDVFKDAKEYGSILRVKNINFDEILDCINSFESENKSSLNSITFQNDFELIYLILKQAKILNQTYEIVITNPPYMGSSGMNSSLKNYLNNHFPDSKTDLFSVFIERCLEMTNSGGYYSMITQQSWLFLNSFEKLREKLLNNNELINLLHLGPNTFEEISGEVVQSVSFTFRNQKNIQYIPEFYDLKMYNTSKSKELNFIDKNYQIFSLLSQKNFLSIPSFSFMYKLSEDGLKNYTEGNLVEDSFIVKRGPSLSSNSKYIRKWYEVDYNKISLNYQDYLNKKWALCSRSGSKRKWFENVDDVILSNILPEISNFESQKKFGVVWPDSRFGSEIISSRIKEDFYAFESGVNLIETTSKQDAYYLLAFFNSYCYQEVLSNLVNGQHFSPIYIKRLPYKELNKDVYDKVESILHCFENINSLNELSPYFNFNFSSYNYSSISEFFNFILKQISDDLHKVKLLENDINVRIEEIIDISNDNEDNDSNCRYLGFDVDTFYLTKSFISYAVGCMFGRFSLDAKGLVFADSEFNISNYSKFIPDEDNIIPVLDAEYTNDDIVGQFVEFVKVCFGEETLEENLNFIAGVLSNKEKTSREKIRDYFLKDFIEDHIKTYQKRPIYWQFNSGKENGFNCLVYMHRYKPDLVARVRTEYLHITQEAIREGIIKCDNILKSSTIDSEKNRAEKEKQKLTKQLKETIEYDAVLEYMASQSIQIDLDDGVEVNYAKFQNIELNHEGKKSKKINLLKDLN